MPSQAIADTTTQRPDSAAATPVFAPRFPDGIADTLGNHYAATRVEQKAIVQQPDTASGTPYEGSPKLSSGMMLLTIFSFLLIALSFRRGARYFTALLRDPFSVRVHEKEIADVHRTINDRFVLSTLLFNTCIVVGILLYHTLVVTGRLSGPAATSLRSVVACIAASTALFLLQIILYHTTGYVFAPVTERIKVWLQGFNSTQALLGLILIPITLMLDLHQGSPQALVTIGIGLFCLLRIVFICKGFRIFFNKIGRYLYFILYLCALEIVPIVAAVAAAEVLCGLAR